MGRNQAIAYMQLYQKTGDDRYLQLYNLEVGEAQGHITKEQKEEQLSIFKKLSILLKLLLSILLLDLTRLILRYRKKGWKYARVASFIKTKKTKIIKLKNSRHFQQLLLSLMKQVPIILKPFS